MVSKLDSVRRPVGSMIKMENLSHPAFGWVMERLKLIRLMFKSEPTVVCNYGASITRKAGPGSLASARYSVHQHYKPWQWP